MPIFNPTTKLSRFYPWPRNLLFPYEKEGLKKYSKNCLRIVEIGVFEGASACIFKKNLAENGILILIDPFTYDSMDKSLVPRKFISKLNVTLTYPFSNKVIWIEKKSQNVYLSKFFRKGTIDFLFIDGDHTEEASFNDWIKFSPYVRKEGLIALHDSVDFSDIYSPATGHDGPKRLRRHILQSSNYTLISEFGTISLFKRRK